MEKELKKLTEYAKDFLLKNYGLGFEIPIKVNNRLRRAVARYRYFRSTGEPLSIELSGRLMEYGTKHFKLSILRHELIHYAMHSLNRPYNDGHPEFEKELRRHEAPSTNQTRVGVSYLIKCGECNKEGETSIKKVKEELNKYRSACCRSSLSYVGLVVYNGEGREVRARGAQNKKGGNTMLKIRIALTNLGKYIEGELVYKWLELPASEVEIKQAMEEIGIGSKRWDGGEYEEYFITDYEAPFSIGEYDNLTSLNNLAEELTALNDSE